MRETLRENREKETAIQAESGREGGEGGGERMKKDRDRQTCRDSAIERGPRENKEIARRQTGRERARERGSGRERV